MALPSRTTASHREAAASMCCTPAAGMRVGDRFRPDIEGLRAVAVLLVVAYHARVPGGDGGFVGVDVFFALSGYLITTLLVEEAARTGTLDLLRFYGRRARRLLPAAFLVLLVTSVVGASIMAPSEQVDVARSARATALYASNVWFMLESVNYFAASAENNPLLHTWSLAVEEQFYLVWPLVVWLGVRRGAPRRRIVTVMACTAVLSFALSLWLTTAHRQWAFFSSPARGWEFAVGGLAACIPSHWLRPHRAVARLLGWLGLAGVVGGAVAISHDTPFPGTAALLPVLATVTVLVAGAAAPDGGAARVLATRPLQFLGARSYSWYLWHWPALVFTTVLLPSISLPGRLACAAGSLVVASLAFRFLEAPLRVEPMLARRPLAPLALAALLTATGAGVATVWRGAALGMVRTPEERALFHAARDYPTLVADGCLVGTSDADAQPCAFGDSASAVTVVLFGDSHAAHWFPALERIAIAQRWRLLTLTKASCPSADVTVHPRRLGRAYVECDAWRTAALRRIVALRPSLVVTANSVGYVRSEARRSDYASVNVAQWERGLRRTLQALATARVPSVVVRAPPHASFNVTTCLSRAVIQGRSVEELCSSTPGQSLDDDVHEAERRAAAGLRGVFLLDLSDQFCTAATCEPVQHGTVVYRDAHHITASYARRLASTLSVRLRALDAPGLGRRLRWVRVAAHEAEAEPPSP